MRALVSLVLGGLLLNLSAQATQEEPTQETAHPKNVPTYRGFEDTDYHEQKMEEAPKGERRWRGHIFEKNPKEYRDGKIKKKK